MKSRGWGLSNRSKGREGEKQAADTGGVEDLERNIDVQRKRMDCER